MPWIVKFDGDTFSSDSMTIEELEAVESFAGSWAMLNPVRTVSSAKALLFIVLSRRGLSDEDIAERLGQVTLAEMKGAFEWVPEPEGDDLPVPLDRKRKAKKKTASSTRKSPKAGRTSSGVQHGSDGPREQSGRAS